MRIFLIVLFLTGSLVSISQGTSSYRDSLIREINQASSLKARLRTQRTLVMYEIAAGNRRYADSLLDQIVTVLDEGNNTETLVYALLSYADIGLGQLGYYKKAISLAERGLQLSQSKNLQLFQPAFKAKLADLYTTSGDWAKAGVYVNEAISGVEDIIDDSLKSAAYLNLSGYFISFSNYSQSYRYAIKALRTAEKAVVVSEQMYASTVIAQLYADLKEYEKSKGYALQRLELARKMTDNSFVAEAYSMLSDIYRLQNSFQLSERYALLQLDIARQNQNQGAINQAALRLIFNVYIPSHSFDKAFAIVTSYPQIVQYVYSTFQDVNVLDMIRMRQYQRQKRYDSVVVYFEKMIQPLTRAAGETPWAFTWLHEGGLAYLKLKRYDKAIPMLEKAYQAAVINYDFETAKSTSALLDTAFRSTGNFERAVFFLGESHRFSDTLQQLKQSRELALAELTAEEERQADLLKEELLQTKRRHNLQYIFITSLLVGSFVLLVLLGFFKVSAGVIRFTGFFSFLFLFEFIFLLLKKQFYSFTHGEPWRDLLIMVLLAAALLPLHHLLEHKLIHYLSQHKLILPERVRTKRSSKRIEEVQQVVIPPTESEE